MELAGSCWRIPVLPQERIFTDFSFDVALTDTPSPRLYITVTGYSSRSAVLLVMQGIYNAIRYPQLLTSRIGIDVEDLRLGYENQEYDEVQNRARAVRHGGNVAE